MARLPEYILTEDYKYGSIIDPQVIPQGAFVKPIELRWLPKHVLKGQAAASYNEDTDTWCFTQFGLVPIPKRIIRKIT